jgi:hypothetical protein
MLNALLLSPLLICMAWCLGPGAVTVVLSVTKMPCSVLLLQVSDVIPEKYLGI